MPNDNVPGAAGAQEFAATAMAFGRKRFWYQIGTRFVAVDPDDGSRRDEFEHNRLAAALSVASRHAVSAGDLPITAVETGDSLRFNAFESRCE